MSSSKQQGFTLLELVIVIIIISTLLALAIDKLMKLQVQAERSAMQTIIGHLQSAISMTISEHIVRDDIPGLDRYIASNPMDLLADPPVNYVGQHPGLPKNIESASWWYDTTSHTLYYQVKNHEHFQTDGLERDVVKLKLLPVYVDNNRNGRYDRRDTLKGLRLAPLAAYRWLDEPIKPNDYAQLDSAKR